MVKILGATVLAGSLFLASQASAVTVANIDPTHGQLDLRVLKPGDNLLINQTFDTTAANPVAYLFNEGFTANGDLDFLLHFNIAGSALNAGYVSGSFQFDLGPQETLLDVYTSSAALMASDNLADGAIYERCAAVCMSNSPAWSRGLELGHSPGDDSLTVVKTGPSTYTVTYDLQTNGGTLDEARFVFDPPVEAAPEPAAWALMIGGFGLAGAALRRRRGSTQAI